MLCEKYFQHRTDLCDVFIDFKKAFDRTWYAALWESTKKYNVSANLVRFIKDLYDMATSAILFNHNIGNWCQTTIRVRQGCPLSPTLFKIVIKRIRTDALEDH